MYLETISRTKNAGFTLIELMMVVTIIAIIAALAFPSYTQYVDRAKRSEARTALMDAAARLERFYSDNNRFSTNGSFPAAAGIRITSENANYKLKMKSTGPNYQNFKLIAEPLTFSDTDCGKLTLTHTGKRGTSVTGADVSDCWGK